MQLAFVEVPLLSCLFFLLMFFQQDEVKQRLIEELEVAKDKARRRSLGNIKFIGELFKLKMLTEVIMHDCIVKLLKNHDEESLECLCRLLSTIGKDLDFEKAKVTENTQSKDLHWQTSSHNIHTDGENKIVSLLSLSVSLQPRMDQYFNQMEKIIKERKTTSRIRFMLQDVLDLRRVNHHTDVLNIDFLKFLDELLFFLFKWDYKHSCSGQRITMLVPIYCSFLIGSLG